LLLITGTCLAQNHMTPEMLWSLKRVSGNGVSESGKTLYYSATNYNIQTEKASTQKYALNIDNGSQRNLDSKNVIQREGDVWYALEDDALYRSKDFGRSWEVFYSKIKGVEN